MEILEKAKKGFTLIEVMVAITIFAVISIFVSDIYIEVSKYYFNSLSNRNAQQNVKVAMETITRYVKQSSVADWDPVNKKLTVHPKDDIGGVAHVIVFQLTGNAIKMGVDGSAPTFLTSETLSISQLDVSHSVGVPAIVKITITADIEGGTVVGPGKGSERGVGGDYKITMATSTALKAQYNY